MHHENHESIPDVISGVCITNLAIYLHDMRACMQSVRNSLLIECLATRKISYDRDTMFRFTEVVSVLFLLRFFLSSANRKLLHVHVASYDNCNLIANLYYYNSV